MFNLDGITSAQELAGWLRDYADATEDYEG